MHKLAVNLAVSATIAAASLAVTPAAAKAEIYRVGPVYGYYGPVYHPYYWRRPAPFYARRVYVGPHCTWRVTRAWYGGRFVSRRVRHCF